MGELDIKAKEYMSRNDRFADAFNFYLYKGEQRIKAENLKELDTTEYAVPFLNGKEKAVQKYRDILKSWKVMEDTKAIYVLLGIELQSNVHYAMPVRNALYDFLNYSKQVSNRRKSIGNNKSRSKTLTGDSENISGNVSEPDSEIPGITASEFLSGFTKSDKLKPVITLTVYLGADKWDGPLSLKDMFEKQDESLDPFLPDYKLNLLTPESISHDIFRCFSSELGKVLECIKYSNDKEKLVKAILENSEFRSVERDTVSLINETTGAALKYDEKEDTVDMCKAIEDLKRDARTDGKIEVTTLFYNLHLLGRDDDVWRASSDADYLETLFKEFAGEKNPD